ncbi:MAG: MlaD family protein [Planctomycetota bacterium]|jgi:hypothetical protein
MNRVRYLLGLATLVLACLVGWYLVGLVDAEDPDHGFQLQVEFLDLRGLKPGADVKYRGIPVGGVRRVDISKDGKRALASLVIDEDKSELVRDSSRFWIVTPRFRGLIQGASGLETLVRNSYVAFITPNVERGTPLKPFMQLIGEEHPYVVEDELRLPPIKHNDLRMRLLLAENHNLQVGAKVLLRGMPVGEVHRITLAPGATYVDVLLRIDSTHRASVTDKSVFWVARPRVSGAIFTGFSIRELNALFTPHIRYWTPARTGQPVENNYKVRALTSPPDIAIGDVPESALESKPAAARGQTDGVCLVRVIYNAVEKDTLSPDDPIYREGTGILYVDERGRTMVLTARSVCDARYDLRETFGGGAEVEEEKVTVMLADGKVLRANRIAVGKDGADLVVLQVKGVPHGAATTAADRFRFVKDPPKEDLKLLATGKGGVVEVPQALAMKQDQLRAGRGGAVLQGDVVVGILGRKAATDETPAVVPLTLLPEPMRPRR